jgi:hypothetical protein
MGIGTKLAKRKGKKVVENAAEGIPVVGDMVDKNVKSGPMDRVGDSVDKGKDKLDKSIGKAGKRRGK